MESITGYREILASIVGALRTIPGDIHIQTQDVKEGFKRPSFFVGFERISPDNFMGTAKVRDITMKVVYFPSDKHNNSVEILTKMDEIEDIFTDKRKITVLEETDTRESVVVEVNNSEFTETNDIIEFLFDITLDERLPAEEHPDKMEELEIGDDNF